MAHAFEINTAPLVSTEGLNSAAIAQARIDLAACFRMAARLGMGEGICNHFSVVVPGRPELFLVNPYGLAFAEVLQTADRGVARQRGRDEAGLALIVLPHRGIE